MKSEQLTVVEGTANNAPTSFAERLKEAGIPKAFFPFITEAGLAAIEQQRAEYCSRVSEPRNFERYCEVVVDAYLTAKGLAVAA